MIENQFKKQAKIKFTCVTKEYELIKNKGDRLYSLFQLNKGKFVKKKRPLATFLALHNVSFEVESGTAIGLIGINGSGKSTLANILSGIVPQTAGIVEVQGEASLISIGAGLKNELTGIENIRLKSLMMGQTTKEINESLADIIEFTDIGDFITQPVKTYSSGMKSRLGFSIAVHMNPDILIIDEALSVGDETFYQKCVEKILAYKDLGKTIFFVSHSLPQIQLICDKVMWMHYGEMKEFGETEEIINHYKAFIQWFKQLSNVEKSIYKNQASQRQKTKFEYKKCFEDMDNKRLSRKQRIKKEEEYFSLKRKNDEGRLSVGLILLSIGLLLFFGTLVIMNLSGSDFSGTDVRYQSIKSPVKALEIESSRKKIEIIPTDELIN